METRRVVKIDFEELTRRRTELEIELNRKSTELLSVIFILDNWEPEEEVISLSKLKEEPELTPVEDQVQGIDNYRYSLKNIPKKIGRPKGSKNKTMPTKDKSWLEKGRKSRYSDQALAEKIEENNHIQEYKLFDELTRQEVLELNETVIFRYEADILGGYEDSRKRQFNSAKKLHQLEILKRIRLALVREWDKRRENNNL